MWRPPLPELKSGKADTDCPSEANYYEVWYMDRIWPKKGSLVLKLSSLKTQLIKRCWAHNVALRPPFEQVKKMLDKMNPNKVSPVDMMMTLVIASLLESPTFLPPLLLH